MSLVLLLLASHAMAEPRPWMKRDNPESLGLLLFMNTDCPLSEEEVKNDIRGEFLRARIKPVDLIADPAAIAFNLTINVHCLETETVSGRKSGWSMFVDTRFGDGILLFAYPAYGSLFLAGNDSGGIAYMRSAVKESAEAALTDYLEANFGQ